MGRERRIFCHILTVTSIIILTAASCQPLLLPIQDGKEAKVTIVFNTGEMQSKALDPDETLISDISLLVFDTDGNAEECTWLPYAGHETTISLIPGNTYSICACANFGYQVYADHIDELKEVTYYIAYPDEYREGMPMFASLGEFTAGESDRIMLNFERLMAKICLKMDRSRLSEGVSMNVIAARIGNCPKSVNVCGPSRVSDHDQCFTTGFSRGEFEIAPLNVMNPNKISGEVALYMLENMQGNIVPALSSDQEKVFSPEDPRYGTCSYIELELEYMSDSKYSSAKNLKYRFYLGDGRNNLDVERNCKYSIGVRPEDDGLSGDGWRVDKSGILDRGPISFAAYPSKYIRGDIGDQIHIWCEVSPYGTPFDVGLDYMEDDKANGIYDYVVDEDGHGATLTLTGPGTGLIYMEAGDPVNEGAMFFIEVNLPK